MNKEKTMDERLKTYALNQQPMHDLDRHMPPTSKKSLFWIALCSPILALGAWLWLIILALKES
jgi:hypothetical protein